MYRIAEFLRVSEYYNEACVMIKLPPEIEQYVGGITSQIDESQLNKDAGGIESNPHITVLYGVEDDCPIRKYFKKPITIQTDDKITYFDNDASVAKIAIVNSPELNALHDELKENENNLDKWPVYQPHITLAYLKAGERLPIEKVKPFKWVQKDIRLTHNGLLDHYEI